MNISIHQVKLTKYKVSQNFCHRLCPKSIFHNFWILTHATKRVKALLWQVKFWEMEIMIQCLKSVGNWRDWLVTLIIISTKDAQMSTIVGILTNFKFFSLRYIADWKLCNYATQCKTEAVQKEKWLHERKGDYWKQVEYI